MTTICKITFMMKGAFIIVKDKRLLICMLADDTILYHSCGYPDDIAVSNEKTTETILLT